MANSRDQSVKARKVMVIMRENRSSFHQYKKVLLRTKEERGRMMWEPILARDLAK